jgi:SAM-dependent methyltransferase/uncharacterized protein YbaR (Trm112 family)
MLNTTLGHLSCPKQKKKRPCGGTLGLNAERDLKVGKSAAIYEITSGELKCAQCGSKFPILGGVAVVVSDVRDYLLSHVKGIAQVVSDSEIPREYRREFLEAKAEIQFEHIEEDLEAERVNALYMMNHYLRVSDLKPSLGKPWWKPEVGAPSVLIDQLIREYWDHGPFAQIGKWLAQRNLKVPQSGPIQDVLELGCGVGGLYLVLKPYARSYLGVDSSFASIALARHLILGVRGPQGELRIPEDLLTGSVSRSIRFQIPKSSELSQSKADFIVGDLANLPLRDGRYDLALALNAIDMLDEPSQLPALKYRLLKKNGMTVQSSPYVWHEAVAAKLRKQIPKKIKDSAQAVEWLYQQAGFKIEEMCEQLPWLFFKNVRQMEIYSVQIFLARRLEK